MTNLTIKAMPGTPMTPDELNAQVKAVSEVSKALDHFTEDELDTDYSKMTHHDEVLILLDILREDSIESVISAVPEIYEPIREYYNNEILARWEEQQS